MLHFCHYNPDGTVVQYVNQLGKNSPLGAGRAGQMTAGKSHNSKSNRYLTLSNQFDITLMKNLVVTAVYDYRQRDRLYRFRNNTFDYSRTQGVIETFTSGSVANNYTETNYGYKGNDFNVYGTYDNDLERPLFQNRGPARSTNPTGHPSLESLSDRLDQR